jgi:DNA-directed RNA polymerase alpha subunit
MNDNHGGEDMGLSVRAIRMANRVGVGTVRDLARLTAEELLSTSCFGETSLREIQAKLAERRLRLGMTPLELDAQPGARGNLVAQGQPGTTPPGSEHEHESACCGHCEKAAGALRERVFDRKFRMSLAELELSVRATYCLESEGITTVRDLVVRTDEELLEVRGFGKAMLKEVKVKLAAHGLQLGLKLSPLPLPAPVPKRR